VVRKILFTLTVGAAALAATVFSQTRVDALHREATDDELLYIPSKAILKHLTAGMSNVVADLLWIETIQYTVREYHNPERKFAWLNHMINAAVELDPYFAGVYQHGGMFLSAVGSDDRALDLLERGFVKNPETWEIPYEIVKIFTLNRRDAPGSPALAAQWLRIMAPRHKHPDLYFNWARQIEQQNNLGGQSRAIWEDVIATAKDPFVREVAQRNLRILVADDTAKALQKLAERYATEQGHAPASLEEFVRRGWIPALPAPEEYGEFFLDDTGRVQSVTVLEDTRDRMLLGLNTQLTLMSNERGRKPASLDEFAQWMGNPISAHPVPGRTWTYDPAAGKIS
jgi:hypothetical protein